jgi:hypothetical protein
MTKIPSKFIEIPIKCKTEEYSEIKDYIEKGVFDDFKSKNKLEKATEYRISRLQINSIVCYYNNSKGNVTLIDISTGDALTTSLSIKELDILIRKAQKNIWNLWGILL